MTIPTMSVSLTSILSFINLVPSWLSAASGVVAAASAVTALTPTPRDDQFIGKIYRVLDLLALNIGHAKDAPPNQPKA